MQETSPQAYANLGLAELLPQSLGERIAKVIHSATQVKMVSGLSVGWRQGAGACFLWSLGSRCKHWLNLAASGSFDPPVCHTCANAAIWGGGFQPG